MTTVDRLLAGKGGVVHGVSPEDPVLTALERMAAYHVGALVVMDGDRLAGVISERDYARKVILQGRSSAETPVWQIMSSPVVTVAPGATVHECMSLMTERRIRHLPVVQDNRVVGMLSIGDLVKAVIAEQRAHIAELETYIRG